MQNSLLKLTAVAGVVGISMLVIMQVQRGLVQPEPNGLAELEEQISGEVSLGQPVPIDSNTADSVADTSPDWTVDDNLPAQEVSQVDNAEFQEEPLPGGLDFREPPNENENKPLIPETGGDPLPNNFQPVNDPPAMTKTGDDPFATEPELDSAPRQEEPAPAFSEPVAQTTPPEENTPALPEIPFVPSEQEPAKQEMTQTPAEEPFPAVEIPDFSPQQTEPAETTPVASPDFSEPPAMKAPEEPAQKTSEPLDIQLGEVTELTEPKTPEFSPTQTEPPEANLTNTTPKRDPFSIPPAVEGSLSQSSPEADSVEIVIPQAQQTSIPQVSQSIIPQVEKTPEPKPLQPIPQQAIPAPSQNAVGTEEPFNGDGVVNDQSPRGLQKPRLTIEKQAPNRSVLGEPMVYRIVVKNVGRIPAHKVVVTDRVPKGATLSGTIPRAELDNSTLIWQLGTIKPGQQQKIAVKVIPTSEGEIGSIATVNFASEIAAATQVSSPHLQITLAAPGQVYVGQTVTLQFTISNMGTGSATGVVVRNLIPNGLQHAKGNDLEYDVGTIPAGQQKTVTLNLAAKQAGQVINRAIVTAEGGVTAETQAELVILGSSIKLSRTGPNRRHLGRVSMFENIVQNASQQPAAELTVVETIPVGFDFVEASDGGQYNERKRTIAWRIAQLGGMQQKSLRVKLVPKSPGSYTSVVRVYDANGNSTEQAMRTEVISYAALDVDISGANGTVAVGEKVTQNIRVRNRGTAAATNIRLKVVVPPQLRILTFSGAQQGVVQNQNVMFAPVAHLDPNTDAEYQVVLQAVQEADARLKVDVQSDEMQKPLSQQEAVIIYQETL